jgi:hypothetical protein
MHVAIIGPGKFDKYGKMMSSNIRTTKPSKQPQSHQPNHHNPITTTRYNERTSDHEKDKFFKTKTSSKSLRK